MGFKMYFAFAAISAALRIKAAAASGAKADVAGALLTAMHSAARSAAYLTAYSVSTHLGQCFVQRQVRMGGFMRDQRVQLRCQAPAARGMCT